MNFYLISTDHLTDRLWFRDEEDFRAGMNFVAVASYITKVNLLAFILMSNHTHFVLECDESSTSKFINLLKKSLGQYLHKKYGEGKTLRRISVDIQVLNPDNESLERAIAYVLMNPVAANISLNASDYPWGSGSSYFRVSPQKGISANALSKRALARLLHSKAEIPDNYLIIDKSHIAPESYVKTKLVESIFRSPKRMNYFLMNSSKARKVSMNERPLPSFRDQVLVSALSDLCRSLFHKTNLRELDESQKAELIRQIHRRFSSGIDQISRVSGLEYSEVAKILDRFW